MQHHPLVLGTVLSLLTGADLPGSVAPERAYDIEAVHLDLKLSPETREVSGTVRYRARPLHTAPLILDQVDIDILDVRGVDAAAPPYRVHPGHLVLDAKPEHLGDNGLLDVEIEFKARPWTGVHFRGDSTADAFPEVWTQGQRSDHRHWLPSWDHPNDRFDYTGDIEAPDGWRAVTNSGRDMPTYLIMFAAGRYDEVVHASDPTTQVWVPPGTSPEAVAAVLDPIPAMKAHFAMRTGQDYPWGDYLQVFVQRFLYFGMENTGATINAARALVDDRVDGTRPRIELLIAHELAHQWFGDLLTCRTWRDLWLNEGFATFMASDYAVNARGDDALRDAEWAEAVHRWFDRSRDQAMPMARRYHHGPGKDAHNVYNRGAATLWMLRADLGEDAFWKGIQTYVARHAHGPVETVDLRRAFEDGTGRDLTGFFQQWTETPGSPTIQVDEKRDGDTLILKVKQLSAEGRPFFSVPVEVMVKAGDETHTQRRWMASDTMEFHIAAPAEVDWVAVDPRGAVSAVWTHEQPAARLEAMALEAPAFARLSAIRKLGQTDSDAILGQIVADPGLPHPYRTAAARSLGEQRSASLLLAALNTDSATVRHAVATALGGAPGDGVVAALQRTVERDPNPDVRAAALGALSELDPEVALRLARKRTRLPGQENTWLAGKAVGVLGRHGDKRDLDRLLDPTLPYRTRNHALAAAVVMVQRESDDSRREALGKRTARFAETLLSDDDLRTREAGLRALEKVGDPDSLPLLARHLRESRYAREQQGAERAIDAIRKRKRPDHISGDAAIDARMEALEKRLDSMQSELDEWHDQH